MSETLDNLAKTLQAALDRRTFRAIDFFKPYPKQTEHMDAGFTYRERLLMAGNQVGKTYTGAGEASYHLTGEYPDDWFGRRFDHPTRGWVCGVTGLLVRDVQQKLLCGEPGVPAMHGSGLIPRDRFIDKPSLARGVTDAFDTIQVEHRTNGVVDGVSIARFKSYEQGRTKFQGESIHWGWCDEEPDEDVYSEIVTRTTATGGIIYMTFTPLMGRSKVVARFLDEQSADRHVTTMTIHGAEHIPVEKRAAIIAAYPEHEREARANGVPMLGSGLIYPYSDEMLGEPALEDVPPHWAKIWGIDFGYEHPFAAVLLAWDKDTDILHVLHTIKMKGGPGIGPMQHAVAMKQIGENVPVAWPQDGHQHDKGGGQQLSQQYKDQGLRMLPHHATWPKGTNSVEAGILETKQRMELGKWKVARHLSQWFEERRLYHRKDGLIVKTWDDLMDAGRYAMMMRRFAKVVPLGSGNSWKARRGQGALANDIDFDYFNA